MQQPCCPLQSVAPPCYRPTSALASVRKRRSARLKSGSGRRRQLLRSWRRWTMRLQRRQLQLQRRLQPAAGGATGRHTGVWGAWWLLWQLGRWHHATQHQCYTKHHHHQATFSSGACAAAPSASAMTACLCLPDALGTPPCCPLVFPAALHSPWLPSHSPHAGQQRGAAAPRAGRAAALALLPAAGARAGGATARLQLHSRPQRRSWRGGER